MKLIPRSVIWVALVAALLTTPEARAQTSAALAADSGLHPNLEGGVGRPLRYRPDLGDFVIKNGDEYFNRSLYGGHTAFRVDGGDKPEFMLYLPGRGGNLRIGVKGSGTVKWLKDSDEIVTRYRPGELIYTVSDKSLGDGTITLEVLAYADTEGLIVRVTAENVRDNVDLIWAFGGVNGQRGARDGDIGTEKVPISQYFQFKPAFASGNTIKIGSQGFTLISPSATIAGIVPEGARQHIGDGKAWDEPNKLFTDNAATSEVPIVIGSVPLRNSKPILLSLQKTAAAVADELDIYKEVSTGKPREGKPAAPADAFKRTQLPQKFFETQAYFDRLRHQVQINTPDPYLDAAMGALNVTADALWDTDAQAIMHGAIAWRTELLGWRGPYALDDLGWHDRARQNFNTWLPNQNKSPIPSGAPAADADSNLSRNETGLHSNGDLSNSHYDMNMVFIDALMRHILWTGDVDFARSVWPELKAHLAWEQRLFRREYGPDHLPLYEAYADIWASDDLYYSGGGTSVASSYNIYAYRLAARIAPLVGEDPAPYVREADQIEKAMRSLLWQSEGGTFAESKDLLGKQLVHDSYGLWTFYHTIDEGAATPREAWRMGLALKLRQAIPVEGPGVPKDRPYHVLSETDWMPYTWSINNVVMDENVHTALALWQAGHSDEAYTIAKSAILASMYMGISPGNVGTMNYLDVYRRESQRDFGDSAGTLSRAVVEGLFGLHPDALTGALTVTPGFPAGWSHASIVHPDIRLDFKRIGHRDRWAIDQAGDTFKTLTLRIPAAFTEVTSVTINGTLAKWRVDPDAIGRPVIEIATPASQIMSVDIQWAGQALTPVVLAATKPGKSDGEFIQRTHGALTWWTPAVDPVKAAAAVIPPIDWTKSVTGKTESVDLTPYFNDRVSSIFAPGKYVTPRSNRVSLSLPSQGIGAWAGHLKLLPVIDDTGLRKVAGDQQGAITLPNGIAFITPIARDAKDIAFTSQWDNYPCEISIPLYGQARHIYLLMAGSTNAMQSRMDNGEIIVSYADGTSSRLALRNPETWWPIEQDYFIDDYQFPYDGPLPPRIDLKTGQVRILDAKAFKGKGRDVPGGAATVLHLALDPAKTLKSLALRALANDVVIGLMGASLERP